MNRRDALDPRRLAPLAEPFLELPEEPIELADPEAVLLRFARRAMATTFEIVLPFGTPAAHASAELALDEIDRLEQQMTVYRDDSEVSVLNRLAAERPIGVEANLFDLFVRCQAWHRETRGAFDIATGALVKCWGFYRREGRVPTVEERRTSLQKSGMSHMRLDAVERTVVFDVPGVEINLGSVGKGYALDRIVRLLWRSGVEQGLVHGGHSSVFAIGSEPGQTSGWLVGLTHPDDTATRLGTFRLTDRGLGISAATHQHFEHGGRKLGHILDPRSAWPAEGVATAAVTAPTAAEADALATAFYILGPGPAREICAKRPDLGAVLLTRGQNPRLDVMGQATQEFRKANASPFSESTM
jgi:FAD:protein FMN transferase